MKTKRLIALVLAGLMIFSMPACGKAKSLKDALNSAKETTGAVAKNDKSDASGTDGADNSDNADNADQGGEDNSDAQSGAIDLGGQTVIDNEWATVTVNSLQLEDEYGDMVMKITVENKSDTNFTLSLNTAAINGLEINPYESADVAAGKKANVAIEWYSSDLEGLTREDFSDFELNFGAYDGEYNDIFKDEVVHIYPYGEDKAAVYERPAGDLDEIIVDTDDVKIICTGIYNDDFYGEYVEYYITNKTDKAIYVTANSVSVNGIMMEPYWGCEVGGKHSAYSQMTWSKEDFEENSIEDIEELEMTVSVKDSETYDEIYSETMTLKIK